MEDFSVLSTCILSADEVNDLERSREEKEGDERLGNNNSCINYFFARWWPSLSWLHIEDKLRLPTAMPEDWGHSQKSGGASRGLEDKSALCWWEATAGGSIQPGAGGPTRLQNPPTTTGAFSSEPGKARNALKAAFWVVIAQIFDTPSSTKYASRKLTFKMPS